LLSNSSIRGSGITYLASLQYSLFDYYCPFNVYHFYFPLSVSFSRPDYERSNYPGIKELPHVEGVGIT
jgi:hypothetical protein